MLKVSYSGIRGIVGESLTPTVAYGFTVALGRFLAGRPKPPRILVARDNRPSGLELREAVLAALATFPCEVADLGVCATPTAQLACGALGADVSLVITASHNPRVWNGFKYFLAPECIVMDGHDIKQLFEHYQAVEGSLPSSWPKPAEPPDWSERAFEAHRRGALAAVDGARIRARRFRVAVDFAGGAGARIATALLRDLNCEVVAVETDREPEPAVAVLGRLCQEIVAHRCDFGAAQDMDGDRLVLVNEKGEPRGEDFTLAMAVRHLLNRVPPGSSPVVVKNSSTTAMIDALCKQYGAELIETPVGEVNLSRALLNAVRAGRPAFGGEGSGGVIYPPLLYGRDGACGLALTLDALAATGEPVSALEASLPRYFMAKTKIPQAGPVEALYEQVIAMYPGARAVTGDGLKLFFDKPETAWLQVRPSNTEPIVRVTAEAPEAGWADARLEEVLHQFQATPH